MRISVTTAVTLKAFLLDPERPRYGFQIMKETGLLGGTLYPILKRLEREGWATSTWEAVSPVAAGRPRRRLYVLTPLGVEEARSRLAALSERVRLSA